MSRCSLAMLIGLMIPIALSRAQEPSTTPIEPVLTPGAVVAGDQTYTFPRFLPDGQSVAVWRGTDVQILAIDSGRVVRTVSPRCEGGEVLVSSNAGADAEAALRMLTQMQAPLRDKCRPGPLAVSRDGRFLALVAMELPISRSSRLNIYDLRTGNRVSSIPLPDEQSSSLVTPQQLLVAAAAPASIAFNADGSEILDYRDGTIRAWSNPGGQLLRQLDVGSSGAAFSSATFDSTATKVLVRRVQNLETRDMAVDVWDIALERRIVSWKGMSAYTSISAAGDYAAITQVEGVAANAAPRGRIIDLASGREMTLDALVVDFLPDSRRVIAIAGDRVILHELQSGRQESLPFDPETFLDRFTSGMTYGSGMPFSPDSQSVLFSEAPSPTNPSIPHAIRVMSLTGKPERVLAAADRPSSDARADAGTAGVVADREKRRPPTLAFSPDGRWVAIGRQDGQVDFFDTATGARSRLRAATSGSFGARLAFSRSGRELVEIDYTRAKVFDMSTGTARDPVLLPQAPLGYSLSDVQDTFVTAGGGFSGSGFGVWNLSNGSFRSLESDDLQALRRRIDAASSRDPSSREAAGLLRTLGSRRDIVQRGAVSPDMQRFAAFTIENDRQERQLGIYDVATRKAIHVLQRGLPFEVAALTALAFSPDGRYVAARTPKLETKGTGPGLGRRILSGAAAAGARNVGGVISSVTGNSEPVQQPTAARTWINVWDMKTGQVVVQIDDVVAGGAAVEVIATNTMDPIVFSPDGRLVVAVPRSVGDIRLYEVASGRRLSPLSRKSSSGTASVLVESVAFTPDSRMLAVSRSPETEFWNLESGEWLGSLTSFEGGDWLVVASNGLFDGSPGAWSRMSWREGENVGAAELYFADFYRPGLLADLLALRLPATPRPAANVDRRQPEVTLQAPTSTASRVIDVRVDVKDGGAGVQDVRLFRGGSLVKVWRGRQQPDADGMVRLVASVAITAGANELTAYAFNAQNVKSQDARARITGDGALRRQGTAWILSVGVNRYQNSEFDLKYAVADAELFASQIEGAQKRLDGYARVEVVTLTDDRATRANVLAALARLSGGDTGAASASAPELARLDRAQPEDAVFVYFAGHGIAQGDRFHLVPHDLGYAGPRTSLAADGVGQIAAHAISDLDLERAFEPIDARHIVLVIDACQSGQALESDEARRGPMNSKGLAQLAYEKGMHVLTAAQSYQAALEASRLGHGFLTYALVEDGLRAFSADFLPQDGRIDVGEWLDHAVERVPQLQTEAVQRAEEAGRVLAFSTESQPSARLRLQTPRAFSRRELLAGSLVIAVRP